MIVLENMEPVPERRNRSIESFEGIIQKLKTPQTVVTLVSQIARMQLKQIRHCTGFSSEHKELMTRLSDAAELISESQFMALLHNGPPEGFEKFCCAGNLQSIRQLH